MKRYDSASISEFLFTIIKTTQEEQHTSTSRIEKNYKFCNEQNSIILKIKFMSALNRL